MNEENKQLPLKDTLHLHFRAAKDLNKHCSGLFAANITYAAISVLSPYATIWFSAQLLNELAGSRRPGELIRWVLMTLGITVITQLATYLAYWWKKNMETRLNFRKHTVFSEKFLSMDYADMEKQETMDLYTQVKQSANWLGWGFDYLQMYAEHLMRGIAGILGAIALTVSLFTAKVPEGTGVFTILNEPLWILGIFGILALLTALSSWAISRGNALWAGSAEASRFGNRLFSHFVCVGSQVTSHGDFRMNGQLALADYYGRNVRTFGVRSENGKLLRGPIAALDGVAEIFTGLFSGFVYLFVCLKAWAGAFGVGSITQYVGAITALAKNIRLVISQIGHMRSNAVFLKMTYEFLDIPNAMYQGSLTTEKRRDRQYEVEFRDVSFRYPGAENWALRHVNMKFQVGKRLAIVGENGSGKTTFIKLLCRLYDPQEGQILLNGIDIRKYNYRDYMDIFSIVFQDFQLISQPLGNNVAGAMIYDRERAEKCLRDAGFGDRLAEMPEGLNTYLYKDFGREGVQLSGGEAQKIAIARALYKDAPFIILDEPTAALDPIAEAEIYEKFDGIAGDKTAIYISHRLSSCKFCDEIAVFHQGAVIQQGAHTELVADESGKYYELWNAQAQYYREKQ